MPIKKLRGYRCWGSNIFHGDLFKTSRWRENKGNGDSLDFLCLFGDSLTQPNHISGKANRQDWAASFGLCVWCTSSAIKMQKDQYVWVSFFFYKIVFMCLFAYFYSCMCGCQFVCLCAHSTGSFSPKVFPCVCNCYSVADRTKATGDV